ncbi:MAG: hypothetical protein R3C68_01120 [Myxococcota bacterium]
MSSVATIQAGSIETPELNLEGIIRTKIDAAVGDINDLFNQINALMRQIAEFREERPTVPGPNASDQEKRAFQNAMAQFMTQLASLNRQLESTYKRLNSAQAALKNLERVELPAAQKQDRENLQKRLEGAKQTIDAQLRDIEAEDMDKLDQKYVRLKAMTVRDDRELDGGLTFETAIKYLRPILNENPALLRTNPLTGRGMSQQSGLDIEISPQGTQFIDKLPSGIRAELDSVSGMVTALVKQDNPNTDALQSRWSALITEAQSSLGTLDINALVQYVLRESYNETSGDMYFYAQKVQFFNELKKSIRDEATAARNALAEYAGLADTAELTPPYNKIEFVTDFTGVNPEGESANGVVTTDGGQATTKAELDAYIQGLEEKLSSVGDDAQLANIDLQNMLQKQQQTMQQMSNISKMLHDTGMAIIRKISG